MTKEKPSAKFTKVSVDHDTLSRLKQMARDHDTTVSGFLRDVAFGTVLPKSEVVERLDRVERKLTRWIDVLSLQHIVHVKNDRGDLVPFKGVRTADAIPMLRQLDLAEMDKKYPTGELDDGFEHRDANGVWHEVPERIKAWVEEEHARRDRLAEQWKKEDEAKQVTASKRRHDAKGSKQLVRREKGKK